MIIPLGAWGKPEDAADRTVDGGRSLIAFLLLDLGNSNAPIAIEHTLHILDDKNEGHAVVLAPLVVSNESPIVVPLPLNFHTPPSGPGRAEVMAMVDGAGQVAGYQCWKP